MKNLLTITCLAILVSIPIFGHIEELPIQRWDESRLAANAFEMKTNNNWLVTTFVDKPDMWNTKPPLMIWLQASTMLLIGDTTLAVRLPAALCALATCMFICWFFVYRIQKQIHRHICTSDFSCFHYLHQSSYYSYRRLRLTTHSVYYCICTDAVFMDS